MADLVATRWKKFSLDRLYVNDEAGVRVGWVDLATGAETVEIPERAESFRTAVTAWRASNPAGPLPPIAPVPPVLDAIPPVVEAPAGDPRGRDLALNLAGQAVRAKADEEWQARKDRSKFWAYAGRALDAKTDERAWRVGAAGEEKVGPKLEKLVPLGWRVLHSVPVGAGDSDIDHVLIGPGGVFTINTKFHPGAKVWVASRQIRINGQPVPYLRKSVFEGTRAAELLTAALGWEVPVKPTLVILTGGLQPNVTYKQLPDDVLVLDAWDVPRVFKRKHGRVGGRRRGGRVRGRAVGGDVGSVTDLPSRGRLKRRSPHHVSIPTGAP